MKEIHEGYMKRIMDAIGLFKLDERGEENDYTYWNLIWVLLYTVMPSRLTDLLLDDDVLGRDGYDSLMSFLVSSKAPPPPVVKKPDNFYVENGDLKRRVPIFSHMNTQELLKLSIEKWITIRNAITPNNYNIFDGANETCALCQKFMVNDCKECPVKEKTREVGCADSPYIDYRRAVGYEAHLKAACDEVVFLTELLLEQ